MTIIHITGPSKSGKTMIANALRGNHVAKKLGVLLVDEQNDGDPVHLLEKLIAGDPLSAGTPAGKINWKPEPLVILVGSQIDMLDVFEELVPGFHKTMSPTYIISTNKG